MNLSLNLRSRLSSPVSSLVIAGALSLASVLSSVVPQLDLRSGQFTNATSALAQATCQSSKEVCALAEIEVIRQQEYSRAQGTIGNVPDGVCGQREIPAAFQDICGQFRSRSMGVLNKYQISPADFYELIRRSQKDQGFKAQVEREVARLKN